MTKASVIVVNLDGRKLLEELLPGLLDQELSGCDTEVLVVDNGSRDDSIKFVEEQYPQVRLHRLEANYGFSPAVNRGIEETDGEYVVLLNNDCRVRRNWLAELITPFTANEKIACVGSLILDASAKTIDFHYGTGNIFGWGFQRDRGLPVAEARDEPFRTFFACGAACAFRRDVLAEAGGLLEETFAYFEDVEIGWRLNALGYEVWMNPASVVEHRHGATIKRFFSEFHVFLKERNALINMWCNLPADEAGIITPLALSLVALRHNARVDLGPYKISSPLGPDASSPQVGGEPQQRKGKKYPKGITAGLTAIRKRWARSNENVAALEAAIDFGALIPALEQRRKSLQRNRKIGTGDLLDLMGEPFRPVIGHPREKAFIEEIEPYLREIIG